MNSFGEWCPNVGLEHFWSDWQINDYFPLRSDRFCMRCRGMEFQQIVPDGRGG